MSGELPSSDHREGYSTADCGCCVFVYRADLVRRLREHHGEKLVCKVSCSGTPGMVERTQLDELLRVERS